MLNVTHRLRKWQLRKTVHFDKWGVIDERVYFYRVLEWEGAGKDKGMNHS